MLHGDTPESLSGSLGHTYAASGQTSFPSENLKPVAPSKKQFLLFQTAAKAYVEGLVVTIQTDIAITAVVGPGGLHRIAHLVCHVLRHRLRLQC